MAPSSPVYHTTDNLPHPTLAKSASRATPAESTGRVDKCRFGVACAYDRSEPSLRVHGLRCHESPTLPAR
jgi:hypothetical protein